MTKRGPHEIEVHFDDDAGDPVEITQYITEIGEFNVEAITEESHPFGVEWVHNMFTGVRRLNEVEMSGFYDDATDGPDDLFNAVGSTRTLTFVWGGTKATELEVIISNYTRTPNRNEGTKYTVILLPASDLTETTPPA